MLRIFALLAILLFAGCTSSGDDELLVRVSLADAQLTHNELITRTFECPSSIEVRYKMDALEKGTFTVTIRDGGGVPVYQKALNAGDPIPADETRPGNAGAWTIQAQRDGDAAGVRVDIAC